MDNPVFDPIYFLIKICCLKPYLLRMEWNIHFRFQTAHRAQETFIIYIPPKHTHIPFSPLLYIRIYNIRCIDQKGRGYNCNKN